MEKNLSIIQGLTAADQANPIRITDAGELKVASANTVGSATEGDQAATQSTTTNFKRYNNTVVGPLDLANNGQSAEMHEVGVRSGVADTSLGGFPYIDNREHKLLVEQGKQFGLYEIYVADTVTLVDETACFNFINNSIQDWVSGYGPRYDDIIISNTPGASSKSYLIVTIVRYYE